MTEANFSFTTKVNGDLFTVRGASFDEFHTNVATTVANLQAVLTDLGLLQAGGVAAPLVQAAPPQAAPAPEQQGGWAHPPAQPPAPTPPPANNGWQQQAPAQPQGYQQPQQGGHMCDCGLPMKLRNSSYGNFYSCSKRMDDPSRCNKKINA